jgi:hypothetical protein
MPEDEGVVADLLDRAWKILVNTTPQSLALSMATKDPLTEARKLIRDGLTDGLTHDEIVKRGVTTAFPARANE